MESHGSILYAKLLGQGAGGIVGIAGGGAGGITGCTGIGGGGAGGIVGFGGGGGGGAVGLGGGGGGGTGTGGAIGIQRVAPICRSLACTPGLVSTILWTLTP